MTLFTRLKVECSFSGGYDSQRISFSSLSISNQGNRGECLDSEHLPIFPAIDNMYFDRGRYLLDVDDCEMGNDVLIFE